MALIKYFVDCQKNKCGPLVAIIFGSESEPLMAIDCNCIEHVLYVFPPLSCPDQILIGNNIYFNTVTIKRHHTPTFGADNNRHYTHTFISLSP